MSRPLLAISSSLADAVDQLTFAEPVALVYNPLRYAWRSHAAYIERFGRATGRTLLLGMNPGPFGMAQTGVPFGDVRMVRDWMGIQAPVDRPPVEHPKRPIEGFNLTRAEVSGTRLWGWARDAFGTPERFFEHYFVHNVCPLVFMHATGRNITPDKLPKDERAPLLAACDEALVSIVDVLAPRAVVGIGAFARARATQALGADRVPIHQILHPSPASPRANRNWVGEVESQLESIGAPIRGAGTTG